MEKQYDNSSNNEGAHTVHHNELLGMAPAVDHKKEALAKLKATLFSYLDVARHELDEVLSAFGKRVGYSLVTLLTATLGVAWASVLLGVYLSSLLGWTASAAIMTGIFVLGAFVAWAAARHNIKRLESSVKEIGNDELSATVDKNQQELEAAIGQVAKEFLHEVRPDRLIKTAVSNNPNTAVVGSLLAGALLGYSQLRKKHN